MKETTNSYRKLKKFDTNGTCQIDFILAINTFKDEYMRDAWAEPTLDFHLENMQAFKEFLDCEIGATDKIDSPIIERYVEYMREKGLKVNTINGHIKTLRVFYSLLYDKGYINCNPAAGLKKIKEKGFVEMRDYMILNILSQTGVRLDELCNIEVSDIDMHP